MEFINRNRLPLLWFLSGFGVGLTLISISNAAIPPKTRTLIREIKGGRVSSPEFEAELAELNRLESKYVESAELVERLKNRSRPKSARSALPSNGPAVKKGIRK